MFEVWTRREAWGEERDLLPILLAVADPERRPPMRPWGSPEEMPSDIPMGLADLIRRCTRNEPAGRPSFATIAEELQ